MTMPGATPGSLREQIAGAKKIVVKLGTSSLVDSNSAVSQEKIDRIVDAIEARTDRGGDVIVVSSGAVAARLCLRM